jgi:hypothetical protein
MQFSRTSCHLIPLRSKYSPQHPVLKHLSLYSSLNVRDQVSHPYRTTGKIIVGARRQKVLDWMVVSITRFPPESNFDLVLSFPNIWTAPHLCRLSTESNNKHTFKRDWQFILVSYTPLLFKQNADSSKHICRNSHAKARTFCLHETSSLQSDDTSVGQFR